MSDGAAAVTGDEPIGHEPTGDVDGETTTDAEERHPLFLPAVLGGGLLFGFGLGLSEMYRPEVVLSFLQLDDLGLLFVMGGAAVVAGATILALTWTGRSAPLTGRRYARRLRSMDRNVLFGGAIFGVGWGLSGICPGAAYASFGVGNVAILWAVAGMFLGAYAQGVVRSRATGSVDDAGPSGSRATGSVDDAGPSGSRATGSVDDAGPSGPRADR